MARTLASTSLATWIRSGLDERQWGIRTLAKRMNPAEPEVARRALNHYLYDGTYPANGYRAAIAAAFGVPEDEVPDPDDEEPG